MKRLAIVTNSHVPFRRVTGLPERAARQTASRRDAAKAARFLAMPSSAPLAVARILEPLCVWPRIQESGRPGVYTLSCGPSIILEQHVAAKLPVPEVLVRRSVAGLAARRRLRFDEGLATDTLARRP